MPRPDIVLDEPLIGEAYVDGLLVDVRVTWHRPDAAHALASRAFVDDCGREVTSRAQAVAQLTAERDRLLADVAATEAECGTCQASKARGDCPHMVEVGDRVILSRTAWERWSDDLVRWRTAAATVEDLTAERDRWRADASHTRRLAHRALTHDLTVAERAQMLAEVSIAPDLLAEHVSRWRVYDELLAERDRLRALLAEALGMLGHAVDGVNQGRVRRIRREAGL